MGQQGIVERAQALESHRPGFKLQPYLLMSLSLSLLSCKKCLYNEIFLTGFMYRSKEEHVKVPNAVPESQLMMGAVIITDWY